MVVAQPAEATARRARPGLVDCDVHNTLDSDKDLYPYLSAKWRVHLEAYGRRRHAGTGYQLRGTVLSGSTPPSGKIAGSDCAFLAEQLLDGWNVAYGILTPLAGCGEMQDAELAGVWATAVNDWQVAEWLDKEPRLRASIIVAFDHADLAVAEVERRARDTRFVQVQFSGRPAEPMGRRRYWPIYEACQEHGLAVMSHGFGSSGNPITGCGWGSFYIEDHVGPAQSMQANIISLVAEGVFERFPGLNVVSVENGFGWAASLMWRLDETWRLLGGEVPHLKRPPSEYVREHVWFSTQPIEEPPRDQQLLQLIEHMGGADRLLFASDYPHWDWDAPDHVLPARLPEDVKRKILSENARRLYRLP